MTYDANIPAGGDLLRISQGQIQQNFQQLNAIFGQDHEDFTNSTGRHKKITFANVITDPNLASPLASLFTKTIAGKSHLFFQNDTTANDVFQLTGIQLQGTTDKGHIQFGNVVLNFGKTTIPNGNSDIPINKTVTQFLTGSLIRTGTTVGVGLESIENDKLKVRANGSITVRYFHIGLL